MMDGRSIDCCYGIPINEVSSGLLSRVFCFLINYTPYDNIKKYYSLDTMPENAVVPFTSEIIQRQQRNSKEARMFCCNVTQSM
jgi:hypothetical protein